MERDVTQDTTEADAIGVDEADKLEGKLSKDIAGDANISTKEGTKMGLRVLGVCTEAGNWGASEVAISGLETGRNKQDVSMCKATKLRTDLPSP